MPRPKRAKAQPSAPAPRVRKPAKPTATTTTKSAAADPIFDDIYDASDREDRIVVSAQDLGKSKGKGKAVAATRDDHDEIEETARLRGKESRSNEDIEDLGRLKKGNESDAGDLGNLEDLSSSPGIEVGRKSTIGMEGSTLAMGNFRRRARQPSILGRATEATRSSSLESEIAEGNGLTSVGKKNTSILSIAGFKRRPRQPSIIGRTAARARSSSIGLDMGATPAHVRSSYKTSTFKRRAREPSILRTAQKERQQRPTFDDEDESEDDFNPDDESTPLNLSKTRAVSGRSSQGASSTTPGSSSRKRKLSAVQVPQSQSSPPLPSIETQISQDTVPATATVISDDEEESSSLSEGEEEHEEIAAPPRSITPDEPFSETMAPPRSSSPLVASPEIVPPTRRRMSTPEPAPSRVRRTLRGRTPPPATQDSPISSPPSLTHSPNRPTAAMAKGKGRRQPALPTSFSTAQLQALLPRRRRRRPAADPFDIESSEDEIDVSGLASDDDELSHLTVRPSRRPGSLLTRTPAPLKRGPKRKTTQKKATKRTYGSRTSDKENEDAEVDPDDSLAPIRDDDNGSPENSQELEKRVGKELKKAAKKFEEVDKWELEFEEVTASSSSPRDGR